MRRHGRGVRAATTFVRLGAELTISGALGKGTMTSHAWAEMKVPTVEPRRHAMSPGIPGESRSGHVDNEGRAFSVTSTLVLTPFRPATASPT